MTTSNRHSFLRWFVDNLVWDTAGSANTGFLGVVWAARKLLIASVLAAFLTLRDWGAVGPPEMALLAVVHFVFAAGVIALLVYILQRFSRAMRTR